MIFKDLKVNFIFKLLLIALFYFVQAEWEVDLYNWNNYVPEDHFVFTRWDKRKGVMYGAFSNDKEKDATDPYFQIINWS